MKWNFFILILLLALIVATVNTLQPFAICLLLAFLFAMTLERFRMHYLARFNRPLTIVLLVLVFATTIIFPITFLLIRGTQMAIESGQHALNEGFINSSMESLKNYPLLNQIVGRVKESTSLREPLLRVGEYSLGLIKQFLANLPFLGLQLLVFIAATLFCMLNLDRLKKFLEKISGLSTARFEELYGIIQGAGRLIIISNVLTAFFQSWMACLAVIVTQAADVFLIGFLTLFLSFIPIIGAAPVIYFLMIKEFIDGHTSSAIVLLVFALVMTVTDNLLRAWLTSRHKKDVHPFLNFISVIGGVMAFGIGGLFLGPFIVTTTIRLSPLLLEELRSRPQILTHE